MKPILLRRTKNAEIVNPYPFVKVRACTNTGMQSCRKGSRYCNYLRNTSTSYTWTFLKRNARYGHQCCCTIPMEVHPSPQIYDSFEQRARTMINRYIRDNTLVKKCVALLPL